MKNKIKIIENILIALFFVILFYYGISNIIVGYDIKEANSLKNINILLSKHPLLPFYRILNSLLPIQYIDQASFSSFTKIVVLFFSGLGFIEWIYMILFAYIIYLLLFKFNRHDLFIYINVLLTSLLIFIELNITLIYALRMFYYVNLNPYLVLANIGTIYIVIGFLILLCSLLGLLWALNNVRKLRFLSR